MIQYLLLTPVVSFLMALAAHLIHMELVRDLIMGLTFVIWVGIAWYMGWKRREELSVKLLQGMSLVSTLLALFWDSLFMIPGEVVGSRVYVLVGTICINLAVFFWVRAWLITRKKESCLKSIGIYLFFAIVIAGLSWETLDDWYRWDSYYYVSQLGYATKADFTLQHLGSMNLVNHLCSVYSMFALTISNWIGDISLGARLLNWILAWGAAVSLYRLLWSVFPKQKGYAIVCTLIFIATPWISGFIGEVSLDYAGFCSIMMLLWFLYDNNVIMTAVAASLLAFSKEPGVVVCGAIALVLWIQQIVRKRRENSTKSLLRMGWESIWSGQVIALGIPMVTWLMQYVRLSHWGATDSTHFFGYSRGFLKQKIPTVMTMNFSWLILIMIGIAVWYGRKNKKEEPWVPSWLIPAIAGSIAFLIFNVIFVTFNHARYNLLLIPGLFFCFFYYFGKSGLLKTLVGKLIFGVLGVVLCIQTFWQIDPVSKWIERDIPIGSTSIVSTNWNSSVNNFGDSIVTNRQYTYWDEAVDCALEHIGYEEGKAVVLPGCYNIYMGVEPEYIYYGILGDYAFRNVDIYWDTENQRRSFEQGELLKIYVMTEAFVEQEVSEELYYISVPWYEKDIDLLKNFEIREETVVSYRGWEITIYELGEKKI